MASFRYFAEPHGYSTYTSQPHACAACGQTRAGYEGPFSGTAEVNFVCDECLASGAIPRLDQTTNQPNEAELRHQLEAIRADMSPAQREAIVQQRTDDLIHRTPHLVTWQDFLWPVHCSDYCRYLREAGKPDLVRLASDADGKAFLAATLYRGLSTDLDDLWQTIRSDSPTSGSGAHDVGVYLFQCLVCERYVTLWDVS